MAAGGLNGPSMESYERHLSFSSPGSDESDVFSVPIPDCPSAIFSPLPVDYGYYLELVEMELMREDPGEMMVMIGEEEKSGGGNEEEETEDDNGRAGDLAADVGGMENGILGNGGCKNLLSERNRRKRLNQQLLALRSLVPCISKMDKRSILMDAASYLQSLHRETEEIKREIAAQEASDSSATSLKSNLPFTREGIQCNESLLTQYQIFNIDIDEIDERTFAVKVVFRKGGAAASQVHRMLESLGFNISNTWMHEIDRHQMISTSFIQVKKQIKLTLENLKVQVNKAASNFGLFFGRDD